MHVLAFALLASTIGQIFAPVFHAMSWLLAVYYAAVPNYVVAIAMLTITVMIISFPLNRASTRSMFKMQLLQPEVQKLRAKYKPSRDMSVQERQEIRQKLNEEMMALYRENNVSMVGGCLPNLVIFPIFIVLYDVIRGLTNTCSGVLVKGKLVCGSAAQIKAAAGHTQVLWAPRYIIQNTALYRNLHAANGKMIAFGINLASSVRTPEHVWVDVLPFVGVVLVAIVLQYVQLKQMTGRNTQTGQVAQQMQAMQKFMPLVMALIYVNIPAAVNVYFIFSSLFRIGQQEWMYRRDPQITHSMAQLKARRAAAAAGGGKKKPEVEAAPSAPPPAGGLRGFRARLAQALAPEMMAGEGGSDSPQTGSSARGTGGGAGRAGGGAGVRAGGTGAGRAGTGTGGGRGGGSGRPAGSGGRTGAGGRPAAGAPAGAGRPAGKGSGGQGGGAAGNAGKGGGSSKPAGKPARPEPESATDAAAGGGRPRKAAPSGNGSTPATDGNGASASPPAPAKRQRRPR